MSDDQVKNAIAELQDDVRCRCHPAYKDRGLHDPGCNCDNAGAVQVVADRIAELEAKLVEYKMIAGAIDKRWAESEDRVAELEAKLAELKPKDGRPCATDEFLAVILDELDDNWDIFEAIKDWVEGDWVNAVQGTTLAKLKGESDE